MNINKEDHDLSIVDVKHDGSVNQESIPLFMIPCFDLDMNEITLYLVIFHRLKKLPQWDFDTIHYVIK